MADSRVINTIKNFSMNFLNKGLTLVIKFILRTVFIYTLSKEYLGVNGLFTNILTLLSLADLGFGLALPYSLYKPLKDNDKQRITALMDFYSKIYTVVGLVVLVIGISITPFLGSFITGGDSIEHLTIIYVLFVINSSASYLFIYKRTLITADQKDYLITTIEVWAQFVVTIFQIVALFIFRNYIIYLFIQIAGTIFTNLLISKKCNQLYPYIKIKPEKKLSKNEIGKTSKDVYALFIYKVANAVEVGTDNIIVSKFIGLTAVGILSNYTLIIQSLQSVLQVMFSSMTASIGNLIVSESKDYTYKVYRALNFASFWFYGVCTVCLLILIQPFVGTLWLNNSFLLDYNVVLFLAINFYICGTQNMNSSFRNAYGLFWQARYRPIFMILVNIISSVILVQKIGLVGVFVGTLLSRIFTVGLMDPYVVHKYGLNQNVCRYHIDYVVYFLSVMGSYLIIYYALQWIIPSNAVLWALKGILSFIAVNVIFILLYVKTERFRYLLDVGKGVLRRKGIWKK